jgi:ATP-binding cassette subfamily C protein LapB
MLGAGGLMRRRFRHVINRQADLAEESKSYTMFASNVSQAVQQGVQIGVVAVGAVLAKDGIYGYGAIIGATLLAGKAVAPFAQLAQLLVRLNQVMVGYRALSKFMYEPTERPPSASYLKRGRFKGALEFKDVSFGYPGQQGLAIENMSFKVAAGEKVAILGRIGSGKTTLSRLMSGIYAPSTGSIYYDGVDMRQIDPAEIRENLGVVLQDLWLMAANIEQNISLGSLQVTPQDILWAGAIAGVNSFSDLHQQGYRQILKERGEGLSGGQRQAIALARALARRPPILVLDEPTSAMDTKTEQEFVQRFKAASLNSSVLVITHL